MASSLEGNKILAAVLTAGIIASASGVLSRIFYHPYTPAERAYPVALPEDVAPADVPDVAVDPIAVRLQTASVEAGEGGFRQCAACHTNDPGGAHRVGPAMWDVVGRDVASVGGFSFSPALLEIEGVWTYEKLDGFLENPREWAPGNRMTFAGIRSPEARADMILYLHSLSDDPEPLPEAAAEPAADVAPEAEADIETEIEIEIETDDEAGGG